MSKPRGPIFDITPQKTMVFGVWCCVPRHSRFQVRATPVMKKLNTRIAFYTLEASKFEVDAKAKRREAVVYHNNDESVFARHHARQAVFSQANAEQYMVIVGKLQDQLEQIKSMWIKHDAVEDYTTSSADLHDLGVSHTAELGGDGTEGTTIPERIKTANDLNEAFDEMVSNMERVVDEIQGSQPSANPTPAQLDVVIQEWKLRPNWTPPPPPLAAADARRHQTALVMSMDNGAIDGAIGGPHSGDHAGTSDGGGGGHLA